MTRRGLVAVALLALLVRVGYQAAVRADDGPVGVLAGHLLGDERAYDVFARRTAAGGVERERSFYQAPLYAWALGQLYRVWPPDETPAELSMVVPSAVHAAVFGLQHLMGVLTAVLVATLGARALGRRAGLLAGLMAAISGPLVFHEAMLLKASASLLVFVLALHLWLDVLQGRGGLRRAAGLGLVLGLGVLLRGNLFLLLGVVLASLVVPLGTPRRRLAAALVTGACALVALSPATIHNLRRGEFVLSTYQSGTNAAIGQPASDALADGLIYQPLRAGRGDARYEEADAVALAEAASGRRLSGPEVSAWWWQRVRQAVAERPGLAAARVALKLVHLFHGAEVPDVKDWAFVRRAVPWLPPGLSDLWLFGPLALLGFVLLPWRRRADAPGEPECLGEPGGLLVVRGGLVVVAVTLALFYVMGRYRLTAAPCLWILAAGALDGWWRSWTRAAAGTGRRWFAALGGRRGLGLLALALLVVPEVAVPLPSDENGDHTSYANAASAAFGLATLSDQPAERATQRTRAAAWCREAALIAPFFPAPRQLLVRVHAELEPADRAAALEAGWRLWLLAEAIRAGDQASDLAEVLDGPIEGVQVRAQQLMTRPSAPGGEAFVGPLLAFACRHVAHGIAADPAGRDLALRLAERSLAFEPGAAEAWLVAGPLLRRAGRLAEAEQAYRRALTAGLDSPELRNNLGNVLRARGRHAEAVVEFEAGLALRPGDPKIRANLDKARRGE